MCYEHVESYRSLAVKESLDRYDGPEPTLTKDEFAALPILDVDVQSYLRIEQERLPLNLDPPMSLAG